MSLSDPLVHLPGLLGEMFALPRSEVRMHLATGKVKIRGSRYEDLEARLPFLAGAEVRISTRAATLPDASGIQMEYGHHMIHGGVS